MVPVYAKADDVVVILCGGAAPFVIRNAGGRNWRIVGPSMFGEFITSETYKDFDGRLRNQSSRLCECMWFCRLVGEKNGDTCTLYYVFSSASPFILLCT
jgi:hypothetical protein